MRAYTPEEARLLWTGAAVERMHCTAIVTAWGLRHGVSGSAFNELVELVSGSKDPVTGGALVRPKGEKK